MFGRLCFCSLALCLAATPLQAEQFFVRNQNEYAHALSGVDAGDIIILANGEWRDFDLVITGEGKPDKPITLISEEPGKVILTGQSSLRIGGQHIVVSGLVFRDGFSPRSEVISFRRSKDDVSSNSRVTEVVIDNFSKPDRYESDYWVGIYGRNNRFDHNHLVGKTNKGVTLAVRLDTRESRENGHRIDHNYFGPRPVLGSNGGETIRIGTSQYSMYDSRTLVERNVFDRTDGEVEIVSSKSGGNIYRENLFLDSRGTLTLRHGDGNVVERNVFLGHGKDYTGGVRLINRDQTVRGNYMEGLRGTGFSSALTVMNGVPNSPVNRYVQVQDAVIENNTVVDSRRVTLAAGADDERSAPPVDTVFRNNILSGIEGEGLIEIEADISGISFAGNYLAAGGQSPIPGTSVGQIAMERGPNGLLYPVDGELAASGAPRDLVPVDLADVGAAWYPKPGSESPFGTGQLIKVDPDGEGLAKAIQSADSGDTILLSPGAYSVDLVMPIDKALTIKGAPAEGAGIPVIRFIRPTLFELREGGNLELTGVLIDGALADDSVGNSVIRTTTFPIRSNMVITLDQVTVRNLTVNKSFSVLTLGKSALAQHVTIRDSHFDNITGSIVLATAETEDFGQYNVEYLDISRSTFSNIGGPIAAVYRGGTDESTFGPNVRIADNQLANVGGSGERAASIMLHGVQDTAIVRNSFAGSAPIRITHTVGQPVTTIRDNQFAATDAPEVRELNYAGEPRVDLSGNTFAGEGAK